MVTKPDEPQKARTKQGVYEAEIKKLTGLFDAVDPVKRSLCEGIIQDAAFLFSENWELRSGLETTGMIRVHPDHPELQKPIEAAKQYRQNVAAYTVCIKALNSVLTKDAVEQDDEFDKFLMEHQENGYRPD